MNTKRFLLILMLVALSVSLLALFTTTEFRPVKAQVQPNVSTSVLVHEPAIRMQSGAIQFTDSNAPDFRPHTNTSLKHGIAAECIAEENARPRRYGGCVQ